MMHNCRETRSRLAELVFDCSAGEHEPEHGIAEIKACAGCLEQYQALRATLGLLDRGDVHHPAESYWTGYNERLRQHLTALQQQSPPPESPGRWWKSFTGRSIPVPLPVAAAVALLLVATSVLTLRRPQPTMLTQMHAPSPTTARPLPVAPALSPQVVEAPVLREKLVTRIVYVERTRRAASQKRQERVVARQLKGASIPTAAINKTRSEHNADDDIAYFTRTNLEGFQPSNNLQINILKPGSKDD